MAVGMVQERAEPRRCDAFLGSTVDRISVREFPFAGVRRHFGNRKAEYHTE